MGRPRCGSYYPPTGTGPAHGRVWMKDKTKSPRFPVPLGFSVAEARAFIASMQANEDREHTFYLAKLGPAPKAEPVEQGETVDQWHDRFLPTKRCGAGHRRVSLSSWSKWISPVLGKKRMASLTKADVEDLRDFLDRSLAAGLLAPSTAGNVWSTLTSALKAAADGKDRTLRVLAAPVHTGVLPPNSGASRERPWLYPNEWLLLASCAEVPLEWRQVYGVALYTGLRPNELRALTWGDVDLRAGIVHVTKAWDPEAREVKPPKTRAGRREIPIRPELAALLAAMKGTHKSSELVCPIVWRKIAVRFRAHLRLAGVVRRRLFDSTATEEEIDFRSLRDSYATWSSLAGVDPLTLRRELGHEELETTDRYVKAAASHRQAAIGRPFPAFDCGQSCGQPRRNTVKNGSDCRTRTQEPAGFFDGSGTQAESTGGDTAEKGPGPEEFWPRSGHVGGLGFELALYDVLEREILAGSWPGAGGDA